MNMKNFLSSFLAVSVAFLLGCSSESVAAKTAENETQVSGGESVTVANTIKLNSGYVMPVLGLGTWTMSNSFASDVVYEAIKMGYRLFDTAEYYGNEKGVGEGVRRAIKDGLVKREDVFVTTKVMPGYYRNPEKAIDESNETLGLGYIDLMLVHQSGPNDDGVYKALEHGVAAGKIRSIGISNYYTAEEFERVTAGAKIKPAVVQNENHPLYQNTDFQKYVAKYGTVVESYYPLGGRGNTQKILGNSTLKEIAKAHGKTAAQVDLRWHIQAGYITIPGIDSLKYLKEDFNIFDFELTTEEMKKIGEMDTGRRFENW